MSLSPARVSATDLATLDEMELEAYDAIEQVTDPNRAEQLARKVKAIEEAVRLARAGAAQELRWFLVRLEASRRHGELLGPAENRGPATVVASNGSNANRSAAHKARKIAAVPEDVRERYVAGVRDLIRRFEDGKGELTRADKPSIARLLRLGRENPPDNGTPPEPVTTSSDHITILHGDFREVLTDIAGAVVITDPPYPREFLPLWTDLSTFAADQECERVVAMSGQALLPEVIAALGSRLTYRWCGAYLTDGPATRVWHANFGTKWKPILVYDRDGDRPFVTQDVFKSDGDDKTHHHWGQNEAGIARLVEAFTEPGDLVVDPFLGGGTTAIVCRDLGRRFIGCDVDAAAVSTTRERLAS